MDSIEFVAQIAESESNCTCIAIVVGVVAAFVGVGAVVAVAVDTFRDTVVLDLVDTVFVLRLKNQI